MTWLLGLATFIVGVGAAASLDHFGPTTWPSIILFGILLIGTLIAYWIECKYDND